MKKSLLFLSIALFLATNVSAQKWLDNTFNVLDNTLKVLDEVDKALSVEETSPTEQLQQPEINMVIDSTALEGKVLYKLADPGFLNLKYGQTYFTEQFLTNVTYINERGVLITEKDVALPWTKIITVRAPFKAFVQYEHKLRQGLTFPQEAFAYTSVVYYTTRYADTGLATFQVGAEGYVKKILNSNIDVRSMYPKEIDSWLMQYGKRRYEYNFTEENFSKDTGWKPKPKELAIPKVRGVLSLNDLYDQYDNRTRITEAERTVLQVNSIQTGDFNAYWPNTKLSIGKPLYSGAEGKLQSILFIEKDHVVREFLVSYDAEGNVVDCISIGSISTYGGDRGECIIEGNTVNTISTYPEGTSYVTYKVTPQMKFEKIKEEEE